ncbi:hypothetical protein EYF80_009895 [Liparis tanakae]|uniref:Uncharacterized protein n=1 Tax=Liparis tanakae TaxID=230148 RepID=A0A4Z2IQA0_9TELE|nr:hypothetical protein EYF80_009895 [Liparis tanakae]
MNRSSRKSQNLGATLARPPNTPLTARDTTRTRRRPLWSARPMSEELSSRSQRAVGSRKDTQRISTASLALAQPHTTSSSHMHVTKHPHPPHDNNNKKKKKKKLTSSIWARTGTAVQVHVTVSTAAFVS